MEVKVGKKTYEVKELKYKDIAKLSGEDATKNMVILSTGISEEEYENLSMKDGVKIQKVINELNGLTDFQEPTE